MILLILSIIILISIKASKSVNYIDKVIYTCLTASMFVLEDKGLLRAGDIVILTTSCRPVMLVNYKLTKLDPDNE